MNSKKLRIAQVTNLAESVPPLNKNGLEQIVHYLTEELVRMGHEVTLFATADSKTSAKLIPLWPKAVTRDSYGSLLNRETYSLWSVSEAFKRHKDFDVIHDHTRFIAPRFARHISTPIVSTVHHPISFEFSYKKNYPSEYQPYFSTSGNEDIQTVNTVVVSKFQAKEYPFPSKTIYNGLALSEWIFKEEPGEYLAFLGYMTADKGVKEAIEAAKKTNFKLKIAGPVLESDSSSRKYFETFVKPNLSNQIEYVGPLNSEQKKLFLAGAKATLMPIQWDEPFGMVAIESMACGTPVIGWNRAALPEIIEDGVCGFLVNSVEEIVEKTGELNKLRRSDCRKRVEDNFSVEKMASEYVKLYESLIK